MGDCDLERKPNGVTIHKIRLAGGVRGLSTAKFPAPRWCIEPEFSYRQHIEPEGGVTRSDPIGDWAPHPADAFRTMAEARRGWLLTFKHNNAAPLSPLSPGDWFKLHKPKRAGMKPMQVAVF